MKKSLRALAFAATMGAGLAAQASTFDYLYTFTTGLKVTGSFDGVANGNLVTDISNVQIFFNGTPFSPWAAPTQAYGYSYENMGSWIPGTAVVSFDGLQSQFRFAGYPSDTPEWFEIRFSTIAGNHWMVPDGYAVESFSPARWSLREVSAVPEAETYAMLLAGLVTVAFAARSRKY